MQSLMPSMSIRSSSLMRVSKNVHNLLSSNSW